MATESQDSLSRVAGEIKSRQTTAMYHVANAYIQSKSMISPSLLPSSTVSHSSLEERFFSLPPTVRKERQRFASGEISIILPHL